MHIIQVCQRFYYGGGQERHVLHISKNLAKRGHKVTIVTSEIGASSEFRKTLKLEGVRVKKLPAIELDEPANQILFPTLLSYLVKEDFDLIHAHGALTQAAQASFVGARFKKKPHVFTPHYHPWNAFDNPKIRLIRRYMERTTMVPVIQWNQATITVSDYEKEILCEKYPFLKAQKIHVVPNGVDVTFIDNVVPRRDVRKKFKIPENRRYVLFFGSTTDLRKGIDRAINSFSLVVKKVPNAHLVILGAHTDTSPMIEHMLTDLRLEGKVTACGYVSDKEKVAFLRMADVLISPTIYEAFGIVLAEAMYTKVPVVATHRGGIPYVLEHGKHGYLVGSYKSVHAFAKYTIRLLKDETLREQLGQAGHERVVKKFQWPHITDKIERLYETVSG
jgi:glycosyltransferase involved in cell wall biosynthesis